MKTTTSVACLSLLALPTLFGATLIHDYQFQGNLNDSLGGPALVSNGGTINPANYSFGANQGLSLSNGFLNGVTPFIDNYSILIRFTFPSVNTGDRFAKILDFKNMGSDDGVYSQQTPSGGTSALLSAFFGGGSSATGGSQSIFNGTPVTIVITRNSGTGTVTGYSDGVLQFSFGDAGSSFAFDQANQIAKFFIDDTITTSEAVAGNVSRIMIWDGALTGREVADVSGVPEPATFALVGAGLVGIGVARRKTRKG